MNVQRGKCHERLASSTFRNYSGGLGAVPALYDSHHRKTLRGKGTPQQTTESIRDGVIRSLKSWINLQDSLAQLLRTTPQIVCDCGWNIHN
jgi:hypothetical protein